MALRDTLARWVGLSEERSNPLAFQDWVNMFSFSGNQYLVNQTLTGNTETIPAHFEGVVQGAYRDSGVVFACELARISLFSEARFQWRQRQRGRPGELFGTPDLAILEEPWQNAHTGDLLKLMLVHADIGGTSYVARRRGKLRVMRPDWVSVLQGTDDDSDASGDDLDADVIGYLYHPGGRYAGNKPVALLPEEVAAFKPHPDPTAPFRGMSWMTPVIREVMGDKAATNHKLRFFENGATPNMVVKLDIADLAKFNEWVDQFELHHKGSTNAYKTLYLNAGADATVVGTDLKQLDFKVVQGAGETRIAAAAGVPPIIAGFSEGLDSATYSNYGQARRRFADLTMRPLWRDVAHSLQTIMSAPTGSELWYDDRDIPFLAEDVKDAVESQGMQARTIRTLTDAGFTAESVIESVNAGDWNRLTHSGLFSVQLQAPGTTTQPPNDPAAEQVGRNLAALVAPYLKERTDDAD